MQFWQQLSCNLPQLTEKHPSPMPTCQHLANGMIFVQALQNECSKPTVKQEDFAA
jgi:hypothetical protein